MSIFDMTMTQWKDHTKHFNIMSNLSMPYNDYSENYTYFLQFLYHYTVKLYFSQFEVKPCFIIVRHISNKHNP